MVGSAHTKIIVRNQFSDPKASMHNLVIYNQSFGMRQPFQFYMLLACCL